ncbi:MAG: sulfite exporter TauE/SafE family protein [Thermoprotei archaeon]|nr:MAG: sulfite exporter TauE/SafE family protein [Thermoprotei archaeon]
MLKEILILLTSMLFGFVSAIAGIGGGSLLVPTLIVFFDIDAKVAVPIGVAVAIATSIAATRVYLEKNLVNVKLGLFLEVSSTIGAVVGSFIYQFIEARYLKLIMGTIFPIIAVYMILSARLKHKFREEDFIAKKLELSGKYFDENLGKEVTYKVAHSPLLIVGSFFAGILSALLGIGGGVIKMPLMCIVGGIPIKVATATSTFMVGITAATSALLYFKEGFLRVDLASIVIVGFIVGATLGAKTQVKIKSIWIRLIFSGVLLYAAIRLILSSIGA